MRLLLFVGAVVSLGRAGWNFNAVIDELRRSLPSKFNELDLGWAVGYHIWSPVASDAARRHFVWSQLCFSLFALFMGILMLSFGELIGAALFGGLAVVVIVYIAWQSYRYRVRRPETENEALLARAVMKKPEWYDVLEPREAVIAGMVGLAVVWPLTYYVSPHRLLRILGL